MPSSTDLPSTADGQKDACLFSTASPCSHINWHKSLPNSGGTSVQSGHLVTSLLLFQGLVCCAGILLVQYQLISKLGPSCTLAGHLQSKLYLSDGSDCILQKPSRWLLRMAEKRRITRPSVNASASFAVFHLVAKVEIEEALPARQQGKVTWHSLPATCSRTLHSRATCG